MAETMNPSDTTPITGMQIGKIHDLLTPALRGAKLSSGVLQGIIESQQWSRKLIAGYLEVTRSVVAEYQRTTELHILARKPFNPVTFIGEGWEIVERIGQRTGSSLDASKIVPKDYLKQGESSINGEERLRRIKASPNDPQIDEQDFLALKQEEGQLTLRWLYDTKGITWLSCWGVILRSPRGRRYVLGLCRLGDGSWGWGCTWLDDDGWNARSPSAVLAS